MIHKILHGINRLSEVRGTTGLVVSHLADSRAKNVWNTAIRMERLSLIPVNLCSVDSIDLLAELDRKCELADMIGQMLDNRQNIAYGLAPK